ncbi:MAG TPA: transglutaminase-like domain-containing protein [Bacteroidia bacterium]|nr:transglutaminase-like domain-containing protein [Bacteroidia bacterium]
MMKKNELSALISLLDDPDNEIYSHIRDKLLAIGFPVIPALEGAWEQSFDTLIQKRIEDIIQKIQFNNLAVELEKWINAEQDLLKGALLIARYQYPDLNEEPINKLISQMRQDVWLELNDNLTALEKVKVLNHIIFEVHNFSGNTANFHAPQNSYINIVMETKKGNPLSLSIVYTIIAQSLGIPIYGVNLPERFIVAYKDEHPFSPALNTNFTENILFYINPFSKGSVFSKKEVDAFLKQLKLEPKAIYYEPCSNADIIKRLVRNLISSYEKLGHLDKIKELKIFMEILDGKHFKPIS